MERFARKGRQFDLVILDPPTFSRDKDGKVFTIETGFPALISAAESILSKTGALFCSTNQRNLLPDSFHRLILQGLRKPAVWSIANRPMPADFNGEQYLKSCWVERR
jgi:23S rRNA (cytosine1962-C5)-methyltransferase